jgi:hypothetical protein
MTKSKFMVLEIDEDKRHQPGHEVQGQPMARIRQDSSGDRVKGPI